MEKAASAPDMDRARYDELDASLKAALARAIRASRTGREHLAHKLTKLLGRAISPTMLDTWTASSKFDWHIPADAVPALAEILQDDAIQRQLLSPEQVRALELGESLARVRSHLKWALAEANVLARRAPKKRRRKKAKL